ncbi:MAG TPA: hypothetical protein DDY04_04330 [Bacteroidales bacterium]|nr:hypothetical protein [Bacteroidales bacterium]
MAEGELIGITPNKTIIALVMMVYFSLYGFYAPSSLGQTISGITVPDSTEKKDDKLSKTMYKWFGRQGIKKAPLTNEEAVKRFLKFEGKTIAQVSIIRFNVFGFSVYDTTITPEKGIERIGNSLHVKTWKRIVWNMLLFREGDKIVPFDFAETEHLLRQSNYFEDVNIMVETLTDTSQVNVCVITKDKWTLSAGAQLNSSENMKFTLSEKNFAGLGVKANAIAYYDRTFADKWAYQGEFYIPNYFGSYISSNLYMRKGHAYETYAMKLNRDFFASKTKYAGGIELIKSDEPYKIFTNDSIIQTSYKSQDWWIGRSIRVSRRSATRAPFNLVIALRYNREDYLKALPVSMYLNPYFHSSENYVVSLGLSNQNIYRSSLYYGFGNTEDIPVGFKIQMTSGVQQSSFQRRFLIGGEFSAAEITPLGYLFLSSRMGGYLAEGPRIEQAVVNIRAQYFSNLHHVGRNDIRTFVRYDYTRGAARFEGEREYIVLSNNYGVRGLRSPSLCGQTRMMFNFETMIYSPHYIYGFRPAVFVFADLGLVGQSNELVFENTLYSGFGVGLRLKNESLIFPTFLFRLGYYPKVPADADVAYWLFSTESQRRFEQFRVKEPYILQYE